MPEADRCSLNIPFPSWARDNPNQPDLDYQNWLELMRWADRYHREQCGGGGSAPVTIDFGELGVVTGYSRITYPMIDGDLGDLVGALSVVGSTDTIAEVLHYDGSITSQVGTITIPANELYALATIDAGFTATDGWQMRVTQAGTGAYGLAFHGLFS